MNKSSQFTNLLSTFKIQIRNPIRVCLILTFLSNYKFYCQFLCRLNLEHQFLAWSVIVSTKASIVHGPRQIYLIVIERQCWCFPPPLPAQQTWSLSEAEESSCCKVEAKFHIHNYLRADYAVLASRAGAARYTVGIDPGQVRSPQPSLLSPLPLPPPAPSSGSSAVPASAE